MEVKTEEEVMAEAEMEEAMSEVKLWRSGGGGGGRRGGGGGGVAEVEEMPGSRCPDLSG